MTAEEGVDDIILKKKNSYLTEQSDIPIRIDYLSQLEFLNYQRWFQKRLQIEGVAHFDCSN